MNQPNDSSKSEKVVEPVKETVASPAVVVAPVTTTPAEVTPAKV